MPKRERIPIGEEIDEGHDSLVSIFQDFGVALDYSLDSLKAIEDYIAKNFPPDDAHRSPWPAVKVGVKIFFIGAYTGEVIRRTFGGKWVYDEDDPLGQINAEVHLDAGAVLQPIAVIMERIEDRQPIDIYNYALESNPG